MKNGNDAHKQREGKTALVVDDSPLIREKLVVAFLSAGFDTCREAENGVQAIALAEQFKPDVITLDLSMPVMNGLEAAPMLRKSFPETPIILFTLFAGGLSEADISRAGISLVLEKGASLQTLINEAQGLLHN